MDRRVNYNGEPLKDNEVLVLTPYEKIDAETNVINKDSIVTITKCDVSVKAVLRAVPKEHAKAAKTQFNTWQRQFLPKQTEGRCMIPQPDDTQKECANKFSRNHVSCADCPEKGTYRQKSTTEVSLNQMKDEYEWELATVPAADESLLAEIELNESQKRIAAKFTEMMDKSPKHCLAMILMALGFKGEKFAKRMHLKHDAANRIRNQVLGTADDGITDFGQIDIQNFKVNRVGDTEYYRAEAEKALKLLLKMYF